MNLALTSMPDKLRILAKVWPMVFQFKLPPRAIVVVAGCHEGNVMELVNWVYPDYGRIVGFDIQKEACDVAKERFKYHDNIHVFNTGVGVDKEEAFYTGIGVDATLMADDEPVGTRIDMQEACSLFDLLDLSHIDLLVLNMEGYEFKLVPHLVRKGFMTASVDRLAMQVHPQHGDCDDLINSMALPSHRLIVDELPQWGYWCKEALR